MKIGSFCLIKNEINFIESHVKSWVHYLDNMVFFDGNSTDGTLEVLRKYAISNPKILLFEDMDVKDLDKDYTRLSNEAMWACPCDMAMFLHPDMFPVNGEALRAIPDDCIAASVGMESYAGEPKGEIFKITGRGTSWKNIYRLRNPNLGAHYFGAYGAKNEDTYFSEITGDEHKYHGQDFSRYPYPILKTDLLVKHYSDVRPYARRLDRMVKCLVNQGYSMEEATKLAPQHPRVSLKDGNGFKFEKCNNDYTGEVYQC